MNVLWRGPFHWSAGGEYALLAVRAALDQGVPLRMTMLGDGPDRERLWFTREDLDLCSRVEFASDVEPAGFDACLLTPLTDGHAQALADLVREGRPVVCSDLPDLRPLARNGELALLVPPRDPVAIAEALASLAADGQSREGRGAR